MNSELIILLVKIISISTFLIAVIGAIYIKSTESKDYLLKNKKIQREIEEKLKGLSFENKELIIQEIYSNLNKVHSEHSYQLKTKFVFENIKNDIASKISAQCIQKITNGDLEGINKSTDEYFSILEDKVT